jgi:iron complex transport system substrate-binding protein
VRRRGLVLGLFLAALPVTAADAPPRRVASINLSADEVLSLILPPERLVGVTRWADDPDTSNVVGRVPRAAVRFQKTDMEQLVALAPDLVVVSEYTDADFLRLLQRSGLRAHRMSGLSSLPGIRQAILDLGRVVGEPKAAEALAVEYDRKLADIERRLAGAKRPRVLYWSGGMTAGADTAIGAVIEGGGGINVGRELGVVGIAPPGAERAFVADPDVILVARYPGSVEAVKEHPLLGKLRAVGENRIVVMPNQLLVALSPWTADACVWLAQHLHPERFDATAR